MGKKGDKTRDEIIKRALELFSVKGYYNTSINDLLDATGLTRGGFYGHFPSKEALWFAAYGEAATLWRNIVFRGLSKISDPLKRIDRFIENDMRSYLGANTFPGGCLFLNMAVELSGQSESMASHVGRGFDWAADLLASWLREADRDGILKKGVRCEEAGRFIIISLNGAAALYAASHDDRVWRCAIDQLHVYIEGLRKAD